jgi:hypothetical protein
MQAIPSTKLATKLATKMEARFSCFDPSGGIAPEARLNTNTHTRFIEQQG